MAGRFLIRVDYRNGGFLYLKREYRERRLFAKTDRKMWLMVPDPDDATRFWTLDAAEGVAVLLAATEFKDMFVTVREWDGNRFKYP